MKRIVVFLGILIVVLLYSNSSKAVSTQEYMDTKVYNIFRYDEKNIMTNLDPNNMKAQTILNNVNELTDYIIKTAYSLDEEEVSTDTKLGTGSTIEAISKAHQFSYESLAIVLYGDTTGDGNITSADALAIVKNKTGNVKFNNEYLEEAGRVTTATRNNGTVPSSADALAIIKYKLGEVEISQTYQKVVTVSTYDELYEQLCQANNNLKFESTEQGKQLEDSYNQLKTIVETYCKSDMSEVTKALVLHDYLVAGSNIDRDGSYTATSPESNIENINKTMNDLGFANSYSALLGIAGIKSKVRGSNYGSAVKYISNEITIDGEVYCVSCGADKYLSDEEGKGKIRRYFFLRTTESLDETSHFYKLEPTSNIVATSIKYEGAILPEYRKTLDYKNSEIILATDKTVVRNADQLEEAIKSGEDYVVYVIDDETQMVYEVDERCKKIIAKYIKPEMTVEEKVLTIHDYICSNYMRSTHTAIAKRQISNKEYDCAWGKYKTTILSNIGDCWSITGYFNLLCTYIGVETKTISEAQVTYPFGMGSHMWSLVKIDDQWYHCDCEGGDYYENGEVKRTWFLYSDDAMMIKDNDYEPCTSNKYYGYDWPEFKGVEYYQDVTGIIDEDVPATSLWIKEETNPSVGESYNITARVFPYGSNSKVTYTSSNPSVASIDEHGNITINAKGQATITAKTSNGITRSYTLTSRVTPQKVYVNNITLKVGETVQATYGTLPEGADFEIEEWQIYDTDIATVDETTGEVTGVGEGTAYVFIYYSYKTGNATAHERGYGQVTVEK